MGMLFSAESPLRIQKKASNQIRVESVFIELQEGLEFVLTEWVIKGLSSLLTTILSSAKSFATQGHLKEHAKSSTDLLMSSESEE